MTTNNAPANPLVLFGTTAGQVFPMGSLSGGDATAALCGAATSGGDGGNPTIYVIGSLGTLASPVSTTFGGQVVDVGVGIRKVGYGTLTLTNNILSYSGQTVVSNGTLAFVPLGNNPGPFNAQTNNFLVGSNFTIVSPGILDVSGMGGTLYLGHAGAQTLFGNGTLSGALQVTNGVCLIAPALRAGGGGTNNTGNLTITGNASLTNCTVQMLINSTNTPAYDSLTVNGTLTIHAPSTALVVVQNGPKFPNSTTNVFPFFNHSAGITNITLPTPAAGEFWVTNLNGTLSGYPTVPTGAMALVDTNSAIVINPARPPVQVNVSANTLTLGWPTNLGWILQSETNALGVGLYTNWVDVNGSAAVTQEVFIINSNNPSVFFRLRSP